MAVDWSKYEKPKKIETKYISIKFSKEELKNIEKHRSKIAQNPRTSQFIKEMFLEGISSQEKQG